ncbi:hypothetical protein LZZ85_12350 [Terrimonas sp. NA20]|uniref:Uncharacterized protein n=1 Tax=Terrimonas ginsenosidimutans TaxID=2908004 RepID=A0ABS9KRY4_9BACT|nr:hypothetical protein [Terrimonas ginsenosidimutans]MCG2615081.1 hypothetical protein [Terrimonas ginsenosidimutans]
MEKRLIQITLVVRTSPLMLEYNLSKRTDFVYDVNTADESGQRSYFTLIGGRSHWQFGPELLLPEWIIENKQALLSVFSSIESAELVSHFYNN